MSFDEDMPITITNWARTRAQKIIRDTSFESDSFNIYDPCFSSEEEENDIEKVKKGIRPSKIDYLDHLSDEQPEFDDPFEKADSFLILSPDDEKPKRKIERFAIEPIPIVKLDNFMP